MRRLLFSEILGYTGTYRKLKRVKNDERSSQKEEKSISNAYNVY